VEEDNENRKQVRELLEARAQKSPKEIQAEDELRYR